MITEALRHCAGIGPARLAALHTLGLKSWTDVTTGSAQLPSTIRQSIVDECERCLAALHDNDIGYFVDHLAPQDKWRILSHFVEQASFFDIETTGLEFDSTITTIVCLHRGELHYFVEHENLDDFLNLLDDVSLLVSFNGNSFDVNRVLGAFHIPHLPCPHLDLRWSCFHQGWKGSLKSIAARVGIHRPLDLQYADGTLAVALWYDWITRQDAEARALLLRYCAADVLLLAMLAYHSAGRDAAALSTWWERLPAAKDQPMQVSTAWPEGTGRGIPAPLSQFNQASPQRLRARRRRS